MASTLNPLPTITSSAIGGNTALIGGSGKSPIVTNGFSVAMDSLNFYVQTLNSNGNILSVTSTATGTNTSQLALANTVHRGAIFFINTVSVNATCTLGLTLVGQDPATGTSTVQVARASLDGIIASGEYSITLYPGMAAAGGGPSQGTNFTQAGGLLPSFFGVLVSLTATASGGGANMTYTVAYSKSL